MYIFNEYVYVNMVDCIYRNMLNVQICFITMKKYNIDIINLASGEPCISYH